MPISSKLAVIAQFQIKLHEPQNSICVSHKQWAKGLLFFFDPSGSAYNWISAIQKQSPKPYFSSSFLLVDYLSEERGSSRVRCCAPKSVLNMRSTAEVLCVCMYLIYLIQTRRFYNATTRTYRLALEHTDKTCIYKEPVCKLFFYTETAQLITLPCHCLGYHVLLCSSKLNYYITGLNILFLDRWPIFISSEPNLTGVISSNYSNVESEIKFKCVYLSPFWINQVLSNRTFLIYF